MKRPLYFFIILTLALLATGCQDEDPPAVPLTGNKILKFTLRDHSVYGTIDQDKGLISLQAGALVDLTSVHVMLVLSEGATVQPSDNAPLDLTIPVVYKVTSGTGVTRTYTVTAEQYSDTALLVVDIQNGYLPFYMSDSVIARTRRLIDRTRAAGDPVVFVQADFTSWSGGMQTPYGTWEFRVPEALGPTPDDLYVTKKVQDSFDNSTTLIGVLNEQKVGSCMITGIATQACVNGTVEGGLHRGYRIIVVADAHSSFDPGAQKRINTFNQEVWPSLGAIVLTSDEIVFDM